MALARPVAHGLSGGPLSHKPALGEVTGACPLVCRGLVSCRPGCPIERAIEECSENWLPRLCES